MLTTSVKKDSHGWEHFTGYFFISSFRLNRVSETVNIMYHRYSTNETVPVYNKTIWQFRNIKIHTINILVLKYLSKGLTDQLNFICL